MSMSSETWYTPGMLGTSSRLPWPGSTKSG